MYTHLYSKSTIYREMFVSGKTNLEKKVNNEIIQTIDKNHRRNIF